jgi:hypothetical protein
MRTDLVPDALEQAVAARRASYITATVAARGWRTQVWHRR